MPARPLHRESVCTPSLHLVWLLGEGTFDYGPNYPSSHCFIHWRVTHYCHCLNLLRFQLSLIVRGACPTGLLCYFTCSLSFCGHFFLAQQCNRGLPVLSPSPGFSHFSRDPWSFQWRWYFEPIIWCHLCLLGDRVSE